VLLSPTQATRTGDGTCLGLKKATNASVNPVSSTKTAKNAASSFQRALFSAKSTLIADKRGNIKKTRCAASWVLCFGCLFWADVVTV
jgi:isocitrate dehydrogenase